MALTLKRRIAYAYFDLPYHLRFKIAQNLSLSTEYINNFTSTQFTQKWLKEVIEKDLLEELKKEINKVIKEPIV
jgi:hypothetical protein